MSLRNKLKRDVDKLFLIFNEFIINVNYKQYIDSTRDTSSGNKQNNYNSNVTECIGIKLFNTEVNDRKIMDGYKLLFQPESLQLQPKNNDKILYNGEHFEIVSINKIIEDIDPLLIIIYTEKTIGI